MGSGIFFPVSALAFSILMIVLYFSKKSVKSIETKLYKLLIIVTFAGLIIELLCTFAAYISGVFPLLSDFILKSYLVYNTLWTTILTIYVYYISFPKNKNLFKYKYSKKIITIIFFIVTIITYLLNCNLVIENNFQTRYTNGPSVSFTYIICGILIGMMLIFIIKNKKNLKNKKYIPIYVFIVTLIIGIIIQTNYPGLLIMTYIETSTINIMYHSIENPDIKMLGELYKNKELVEQTYEDKSNFLFELTQEVRDPLYNISNICNNMKQEEDIKKIKSDLNVINNSIRQLDFIVNDVLNVSTLDVQRVKFVNNRYSLKSLYDDVVARIKVNVSDNIEFRTNIPNNVPYLYGDSIKLKQILYSLIMNSVKKTSSGFIEFNVNTIEKYDVCRVIFTIIDSGSGMSIDKINEVLSVTGEFDSTDVENLEKTEFNIKLCQKIIKVLGGNLLIKSKAGKGTEVMLTIDQRIYNSDNDNSVLKQYENAIYNSKKALIVCQDKNITTILKKKLNENSIGYSVILYGMDAVDKIKSGKKYDFIIVQDDMKEMSGYTTLKEMQKLNKFNIPVIVMLDNNKINIKEHYIKDGFEDYILLDNFSEDVNRILNKY